MYCCPLIPLPLILLQVQMDKLVDEIGADGSDEDFFATRIRPYLGTAAPPPGVVAAQRGDASPPSPAAELDVVGDDNIDSDIDLDLGGDDLGLGV